MKKLIACISSLFCFSTALFALPAISAKTLTCEYLNNPLGIDVPAPRLSWQCSSVLRNQFQQAYEILVSDNLRDIMHNKGNVWSTGEINSGKSLQVEYGGAPLRPFTRYYWKVQVYNLEGTPSGWSEAAWFETAMLQSTEWKGFWIGDGTQKPSRDEDYYKDDRMPLLRRQFNVNKKIASARLYISGVGYYEAYLNGKKIGGHMLDPGFTTYKKQVQYAVYDITGLFLTGNNTAGIMLGNGWYNPLPLKLFGRFDLRDFQQTGRPCAKADIRIQFTDGTTEVIGTDESWLTAPGPVIKNNVYLGECYDARLEQPNWSTNTAKTEGWVNAVKVAGPDGVLTVQQQPAVIITKIITPVSITKPAPDTFIVDMGQNFAGVARIKVTGAAGTKIALRYGEALYSNGRLNYMTTVCGQIKKGIIKGGPGAPETAWQEDSYILKGSGLEEWNPRFTFHGFRYVEVTGWPGELKPGDIAGLRMNADVAQDGEFSCSNEIFNKIHEAVQWTFLSNLFSVQSDCPGREKMGYGADMVVTAQSYIYNYKMAGFYAKAVQDIADEQQADGGITEIAPYTGIADRGYGGQSGPLGWELAFAYLMKQLYDYYGDKRVIEQHYPALARQIEFLQAKAVNNLFYWDISDHATPDTKPEAFTASAFYYHHVILAAEFAGILGKTADSVKYARLSNEIKKAIVEKYFIPGTGRFDNATQAAEIFALYYHFTPLTDSSLQVLFNEIARHKGHLYTGIFSTKMFFDVMRDNNLNEAAYNIVNNTDYPGWGYMLSKGATTLWEQWDYPDNFGSQNHPMFGSVDEWFYHTLLGINPGAAGFTSIVIKPQPAGNLTGAKGLYHSVMGDIKSEWNINAGNLQLKVSIPANTHAEIWIPSTNPASVTESGVNLVNNKDMEVVRREKNWLVVKTGGGDFVFNAGL